jgi:SNF2 family DNA or RNA helicase
MIPYPFKTKPYAHQLECWNRSKDEEYFGIFMEMGCGKTWVSINEIAYMYDQGRINAALIVAPKGVYLNWMRNEIPAHMPNHIKYKVGWWTSYRTSRVLRMHEDMLKPYEGLKIFLVNCEAIDDRKNNRCVEYLRRFVPAHMLYMAVDESTCIRNPKAARTKMITKIGKVVRYRRILTGEPIANRPTDVYAQCEFLSPRALDYGSFYSFRNHFCEIEKKYLGNRSFDYVTGYKNLDELGKELRRFSFIVKKKDCLDLPDKIYQQRYVEMTDKQAKLYEEMRRDALILLNNAEEGQGAVEEFERALESGELPANIENFAQKQVTAPMIITQLMRLQQIACGYMKLDSGEEVPVDDVNPRIEELLEVVRQSDEKFVIWATFRYSIREIARALRKEFGEKSVVTYYGDTDDSDRRIAMERFQGTPERTEHLSGRVIPAVPHDPQCRFFVGNPQTAGFGLTLTRASHVVYFSNSYDHEHRIQSEDRCHRIGQKSNVVYVDLLVPGTIDERVVAALRSKKSVAAQITGDGWKAWFTPAA